ncbi:MAG TPA: iron chelate uptake ABC transporter family permease subunit [Nocardioidaceae bacterium]|nr:iron chelate uptake ABC transporter family permease subunit [Nocardioidaceae bacterium]
MSTTLADTTVDRDAVALVIKARRRVTRRIALVTIVMAAGVVFAFSISLAIGDFRVPIWRVLPAVFGSGHPEEVFAVQELRLPRALLGLLVGAAFGMSGAVFQSLARNPLASPDILGISAGGSLSAVFALTVLGVSGLALSLSATAGALVTAVLIYILAYRQGLSSYRLVLVGIGVGAVATASTQYFWTRAHTYDAASVAVWLSGSLNGREWESIRPILFMLVVLVPVTLALGKQLKTLELGDDSAKAVGIAVQRARAMLLLLGVALAGAGIGAAGPVAFVAFVCAPIARRVSRSPGPPLLQAALLGSILVLVADLVGRVALPSTEVPVGILTGLIGAPYLLWVLATTNSSGQGD